MSRSRDISKGTTRTEFVFTATDGQTTFSTDDTSTALAYVVGKIDVFLNGVRLAFSDFTALTEHLLYWQVVMQVMYYLLLHTEHFRLQI